MLEIVNCDSRTGFLVDLKTQEYKAYKVVKFAPTSKIEEFLIKNPLSAVDIESATVDTGEQEKFFGHPAKHFITTAKRTPDKSNAGGEDTVDAWYIDHELPDNNCAPEYVGTEPYYVIGTALVMPPQIARLHHTGPIPKGLAVKRIVTHKIAGNDGTNRIIITVQTIEELSESPINPSLFELPAGLHQKNVH